jgi:hypothetical protein
MGLAARNLLLSLPFVPPSFFKERGRAGSCYLQCEQASCPLLSIVKLIISSVKIFDITYFVFSWKSVSIYINSRCSWYLQFLNRSLLLVAIFLIAGFNSEVEFNLSFFDAGDLLYQLEIMSQVSFCPVVL